MTDNLDLQQRRQRIREKYGITEPDVPAQLHVEESVEEEVDEQYYYASQWKLMWWRFKRHRMALISLVLLILLYLMALFADFIAPYDSTERFRRFQGAPPSVIHWFDENGFRGPYIYAVEQERDPVTLRASFVENKEVLLPVHFFV